MRQILFRGKRIDNGEWVYGFYAMHRSPGRDSRDGQRQPIPAHDECLIITYPTWQTHEVHPATIGQFTNLTDRHGTKIFEGDVYTFTNDDGTKTKPVQIGFNLGKFAGIIRFGENGTDTLTIDYLHYSERIEILGNIHDNPELVNRL